MGSTSSAGYVFTLLKVYTLLVLSHCALFMVFSVELVRSSIMWEASPPALFLRWVSATQRSQTSLKTQLLGLISLPCGKACFDGSFALTDSIWRGVTGNMMKDDTKLAAGLPGLGYGSMYVSQCLVLIDNWNLIKTHRTSTHPTWCFTLIVIFLYQTFTSLLDTVYTFFSIYFPTGLVLLVLSG